MDRCDNLLIQPYLVASVFAPTALPSTLVPQSQTSSSSPSSSSPPHQQQQQIPTSSNIAHFPVLAAQSIKNAWQRLLAAAVPAPTVLPPSPSATLTARDQSSARIIAAETVKKGEEIKFAFQSVLRAWKSLDPVVAATSSGDLLLLRSLHANCNVLAQFFTRASMHVDSLRAKTTALFDEVTQLSTEALIDKKKVAALRSKKEHFVAHELNQFIGYIAPLINIAGRIVIEMFQKVIGTMMMVHCDGSGDNNKVFEADEELIKRRNLLPFLSCVTATTMTTTMAGDGHDYNSKNNNNRNNCVLKHLFACILRLAIAVNRIGAEEMKKWEIDAVVVAASSNNENQTPDAAEKKQTKQGGLHVAVSIFVKQILAVGFTCRAVLEGLFQALGRNSFFFFEACPSSQNHHCRSSDVVIAVETIMADAVAEAAHHHHHHHHHNPSSYLSSSLLSPSAPPLSRHENLHVVISFLDSMCRSDSRSSAHAGAHLKETAQQVFPIIAREGNIVRSAIVAKFVQRADAALKRVLEESFDTPQKSQHGDADGDDDDDDDDDAAEKQLFDSQQQRLYYTQQEVEILISEVKAKAKAEETILRAVEAALALKIRALEQELAIALMQR